jgi:LPS-assembly protein
VKVLRAAAFSVALVPAAVLAQETSSDPFEARFRQRANFQIRFKVPEKGGEVRLSTRKPVQYVQDVSWDGSDEVTIEYQDLKMTADKGHYDFPTKTATLEGHVVIDQGPSRLSGSRAVFQLETKTGSIENATADLAPAYHIVAKTITKTGEATYLIHDGLFTSCDLPHPEWSFRLAQASVTLDDYARMKGVSFRAGPVPILYTPYLIWPTKEDRASGLLVPGVGYNGTRGAYLGLTHFWVTGRATDLTTSLDLYSKGSIGLGEEFRWTPTAESAGLFRGYLINDKQATVCVKLSEAPPGGGNGFCTQPDGTLGVYTTATKLRWKYRLEHVAEDLPWGFRGAVSLRDYSDEQFLQDYERNFGIASSRQVLSTAFVSKNFGDESLNVRFERAETFYGQTILQERFPTVEFYRRTSRLGATPLYLALESSLSGLFINRGTGLPHGTYGRADVHPTLSLPWKGIPWLSLTARAGGRFTGYTDSTDDLETRFVGKPVSRLSGEAGVSLVGPSFTRIYDGSIGPFGKFKHVIEPRVDYTYASNVADPARIPVYDEVDTQLGQNQVHYALVNRLLARPADPKNGAAEEIASFEVGQTYAFEPPQVTNSAFVVPTFGKAGPLEGILRLQGAGLFQFDGRLTYDTHIDRVTSTSITASATWSTNFVNLTWFESRAAVPGAGGTVTFTPPSDQIRAALGLDIMKWLRVDSQLNYDAHNRTMLEDRSLLTFQAKCFTVFLEVREVRVPPNPHREYRLVVNLKDIGTLLDVNGSLDRIFGQ